MRAALSWCRQRGGAHSISRLTTVPSTSACPEADASSTLLSWVLRQLRSYITAGKTPALATAVAALAIMVRNEDLRDAFRAAHGVERLIGLLQTDDSQMLYGVRERTCTWPVSPRCSSVTTWVAAYFQATFVLWALSFDEAARPSLIQCGAVKALAQNRPNVRTKVMRVALAALAVRHVWAHGAGYKCLTYLVLATERGS